jgi:hypothetical protein
MPVPEPVAAVVIDTVGHSFWICAVQRLNSGNNRLDPVSWRATGLVGHFCRLWREAAAVVVDVVEDVAEGDELHAAKSTAEAVRADNTATPPTRPVRRLGTPRGRAVEGRVGIRGEAPFDWNCRDARRVRVMPTARRAPPARRQPAVIRFSRSRS